MVGFLGTAGKAEQPGREVGLLTLLANFNEQGGELLRHGTKHLVHAAPLRHGSVLNLIGEGARLLVLREGKVVRDDAGILHIEVGKNEVVLVASDGHEIGAAGSIHDKILLKILFNFCCLLTPWGLPHRPESP